MKRKITAILLMATIIVSLFAPNASAIEMDTYCNVNPQNLNNEVLQELLKNTNCNAENILANTANANQLIQMLQSRLNTNCTTEDVENVLADIAEAKPVNSTCQTTEVETKATTEPAPTVAPEIDDDMALTVPTMKPEATIDAQPIPTDNTQRVEPIPTDTANVETQEVLNSVPKVEVTPQPTQEVTAEATLEPTPVATLEPTPEPTVEATPTATPEPTAPVKTVGISDIERNMVAMVNEDRANAGLAPLTVDVELTTVAREHSADMSANNFFSHTSPTNGGFSERLKNSGIGVMSGGENIAMYGSVTKAQAALMASDGHRANILGNFTHVGIGIVYNEAKGAYYITQWFARK